jgi:hypothetical protein
LVRTRIVSSGQAGQPGASTPKFTWPLRQPRLLRQRSVNRVMATDLADGATQPEFKNLLGGVALATRNVRRRLQTPLTPPSPNAGRTVVRQTAKRVKRLP